MTSYQNMHNVESRVEINRQAASSRSLWDRLVDICCILVIFFDRRAVKNCMALFAAIGMTVGVYFLASALLGGTIGILSGLVFGICLALAAGFLFRHAE